MHKEGGFSSQGEEDIIKMDHPLTQHYSIEEGPLSCPGQTRNPEAPAMAAIMATHGLG